MNILKRPSVLTFLISALMLIAAVLSNAGIKVPLIGGHEFLVLLAGHVILTLGCLLRGL